MPSKSRSDYVITYFGNETVEAAISEYFKCYGLTEKVRDQLIEISLNDEERFFEIVDSYVMKEII